MADERIESGEGDELIARVAQALREPVAVGAGFDQRVMAEVRGLAELQSTGRDVAPIPRSASLPWLVRPKTLRISPLTVLGAAAAIAAVTVLVPQFMSRETRRPTMVAAASSDLPVTAEVATVVPVSSPAPAAARYAVQFVLVAPAAKSVSVAGSFNDWDPAAAPLRRDAGGVWTTQLPLLTGRYTYSFVVDGRQWRADPAAPRSVDDDFGAPSSVLTVGAAHQ